MMCGGCEGKVGQKKPAMFGGLWGFGTEPVLVDDRVVRAGPVGGAEAVANDETVGTR